MKEINYLRKSARKVNGMYYVESGHGINKTFQEDENGVWIIFHPNHYIVKPALDYLRYRLKGGISKTQLKKETDAICHYYNYCRLCGVDIEKELTNTALNGFIKYLSVIPKRMFKRVRIHPSEIEFLPIHPYITDDEKIIKQIYNEWYNEWLYSEEKGNVSALYNPRITKFKEDKQLWSFNIKYIEATVKYVLEYLNWLSATQEWWHRYKIINPEVTRRSIEYNPRSRKEYVTWDVNHRIKKIADVEDSMVNQRRKRVFYETELKRFFESYMLQSHSQRKLFFIFLLLSGARVSECLNLLIKNVKVSIPRKNKYQPFSEETIVHWEDMFDEPQNDEDIDILLNKYLNFTLRFAKRSLYESARRKNKTKTPRITVLKDYFSLPDLLDIKCKSIFITQEDIEKTFEKELILESREKAPAEFIKDIMVYHYEQKRKGISIFDPEYSSIYSYRIQKIRKLIDRSWLGNLIRQYLIERHLLFEKHINNQINRDYFFINLKNNKCNPIEPQTVEIHWFDKICSSIEPKIVRDLYIPNRVLQHAKKKGLSVHSFRHTYISARITLETKSCIYNDALMKREIGHVPTSTVAATTYFFSNGEVIKEAQTKLFNYMRENINEVIFYEQSKKDE
ncbi:hypothetical protein FO499_27195 [Bacillus anthracis]|nr:MULTISPECIES: hypothetical protein [Bacillus]MDR4410067.1 hypothetical protein [Bacillus anthracis]OJE21779.1 hypothetical protein BAQ46_20795 [Bacillus paranthracis]TSI15292.1 hypothetical protein FOT98_12890 [Bacillus sp. HY001]